MDDALPAEIIRAKRDGQALDAMQIAAFVRGLTGPAGEAWGDAQVGALAMAIVLRGMSRDETVALTAAMAGSGERLQWHDGGLAGPVLDKHSTGGVGDKVSLMLAPIVAACGGIVPMISGRGLAHTGGTLDKLESLPGYRVDPPRDVLLGTLRRAGAAIVGAGDRLAPADRRLYSIRDVTATVESLPLITASILSKKLAAGLQALVLDVKVGSGAFAPTLAEARALAGSLVEVARGAGLPARALITDMNQVLGHHAGNALEVREAIDFLTGADREPRLLELTLALSAELLVLGGLASDVATTRRSARNALDSGEAAVRFAKMVAALGGPADVLRDAALPLAPVRVPVPAPRDGHVTGIDVRALGLAIVALGGGRPRPGDRIDPRVGLESVAGLGAEIRRGEALAFVHAAADDDAGRAVDAVIRAIRIGNDAPPSPPLVHDRIG